jgi:hypothetical protein
MAARPRRNTRSKPLRLACWNADGVRGRKLELEQFLSHHSVCALNETFLNPVQDFPCQLCLLPHRQTDCSGGTDISVNSDIVHHAFLVPGLTNLEATAIQIILAGTQVLILPA